MKAHFPALQVKDYRAPNQNLHVVQVANRRGGKEQFLAGSDLPKEITRAVKARAGLVQWVKAQPGRTLLVVPKDVRERIEDEFPQQSFVMAHYGALEGQDVWRFDMTVKGEELDNTVIAGRMAPPAWAMEAVASAHHFDGDKIARAPVEHGMSWYRESHRVLADGIAGIELEHSDDRVTAALRKVLVGSLMQALGRMRGTRRAKLGRVFIMHNMAIEVGVHEVISQEDLRARFDDIVLLSPSEVERVFGYSGAFIRRSRFDGNVRYWTRDGQTQPFRAHVPEGIDDERLGEVMDALGARQWKR